MAGRAEAKLAAARDAMTRIDAACADVDVVTFELDDEPALNALAAETKVCTLARATDLLSAITGVRSSN